MFDAAKVSGTLTVRRARDGESLLALDGRTHALTDDTVVIADEGAAWNPSPASWAARNPAATPAPRTC